MHQRYKTANGFRTRCNYYYIIWPITLLELKFIITSARNAAAIAKVMVELRSIGSFLLNRRERTLEARSEVLEMLEVKVDNRWFGRLDDDSEDQVDAARVSPS